MKKKIIIGIIIITIIIIIINLFVSVNRYNLYVIGSTKWMSIIDNRKEDNSIHIDYIKFNDYNLIIDNDNNIVYYSIISSNNMYNPTISYKVCNSNFKIAFNKALNNNDINVIIYNNFKYKIYKLETIDYPIINIKYKGGDVDKNNVEISIFDNNKNIANRVINSIGKLKIKDDKYIISLEKMSLGHNIRDNYISIMGSNKNNEFILKRGDGNNKIRLFINDKDMGIYTIMEGERRER